MPTRRRRWTTLVATSALALAFACLSVAGCGDGGGGDPDVTGDDTVAPPADASLPDGGDPDAAPADGWGKPDGERPEDAGGDDAGADVPPACPDGEACDDGDPCTTDDACAGGVCAGTPYSCADDLPCTADVCLGDGACENPLRGGWCLIDGACAEDGDAHPDDPCLACLPPLATDAWSPGPPVACDDGDACTTDDTCHDGACRGGPPLDCGGGDPCVETSCDPAAGCVTTDRDGGPCDDGDACTVGDVCEGGGCLAGPAALVCDDGNPCTDETCDAVEGCVVAPNTASCDDGDPCTEGEACQDGACVAPGGPVCDDGNPCTDDACAPGEGCAHVNNTAGCDNGDPCSLGDRCVAGSCRAGSARPDCADENPCTDDVCTPMVGCEHPPNTNPCDDGDLCTVDDTCGGGACVPGTPLVCDDGVPCTDDLCEAERGCVHPNNEADCDDGNPCTVGDFCVDGLCLPGPDPADCDDDDPCTNDSCVPDVGCVHEPASGLPCDDGDPCTLGDLCNLGTCLPGAGTLSCVDDNDCSIDACEPFVGCTHTPRLGGPCDDRSVCTDADRCIEGECVGYEIVCIDGNPCTADLCDAVEGCYFEPIQTIDCWPRVSISPQRGTTVVAEIGVPVYGSVAGIAAPVTSLVINGEPVPFDEQTGEFALEMDVAHGMNMLRIDVEDELGTRREVRQSFYVSDSFWPMDPADLAGSRLADGIFFYLSAAVIDDGDRSDVDDLATIFSVLLGSFDLNALIPRPAARQSVDVGIGDCDYDVYVNNIRHGAPQVSLTPQDGGRLTVNLTIANFRAEVDANGDHWYCPNIDASVSASSIVVNTTVALGFSGGAITATVVGNVVAINGLDVDGGDILSDALLELFEDDIKDELESAFRDQIAEMIPEMLQDALGQLALSEEFTIPAFLPGQADATVTLDSTLSSFGLGADGITVGLGTLVAGPDNVPYDIEGSIGRGTCQGTEFPGFRAPLRKLHALELALFDDVLNQILYTVWAAGTFEFTITAEELGQDLSGFGIDGLDLRVSFMLPPIVEWCDAEEPMLLQIGDIRIDATISLLGQQLDVTMFASLEAGGGIQLAESDAGDLELGLAVDGIRFIDVDIALVDVGYEDFIPVLRDMIEVELLPSLLDGLSGGALGSFPIPAIDLSGFDESIPEGTGIAIAPEELWRTDGYTTVGGQMQAAE